MARVEASLVRTFESEDEHCEITTAQSTSADMMQLAGHF